MRQFLLSSSAAIVLAVSTPVVAQQSADEAQLRRLIAAHQAASENGDLRGLVDIYSSDAEIISSTGRVTQGRGAIEADYRASLDTASSKSGRHHTHPTDSIRIRFVTPDVALIEVASVNVGGTSTNGTPMADSRSELITTWRKEGGAWKVTYQRALPAK